MSQNTYTGRMFITVTFDNLCADPDADQGDVLSEVVGNKVLGDLRRAVAQLPDTQGTTYTFEADLRVLDVTESSDERAQEPM
jgi:hypothetical protein